VFVQSITSNGWRDRTSTVSLVSSANPSTLGSTVTFTATASGSSGTPAGRVLFMVDGFVVGDPAGVPLASGQAAVSAPNLAGGRHKVTATYLGTRTTGQQRHAHADRELIRAPGGLSTRVSGI
jgi:hypothetical protein